MPGKLNSESSKFNKLFEKLNSDSSELNSDDLELNNSKEKLNFDDSKFNSEPAEFNFSFGNRICFCVFKLAQKSFSSEFSSPLKIISGAAKTKKNPSSCP